MHLQDIPRHLVYEAAWAAGRGVPRLLAALTGRYQLRVNTGRSDTGYRWVKGVSDSHLFPFLIIRIYMTSSSGLTIAINHASHFSNGQWLLLAGPPSMMAVIALSALYAVVRGRGEKFRCNAQHYSLVGGVKITLHIYSLDFSSLLMTTA